MASTKDDVPYHMRQEEVDEHGEVEVDAPVPPSAAATSTSPSSSSDSLPEGVERIELGSIKTNPGIEYSTYQAAGKGLISSARVTKDGRIVISLDLKKNLGELPQDYASPVQEFALDEKTPSDTPPLAIVIMIVGSRGDVQPYIALGLGLKQHGHRIRLATHETFRKMVTDAGLEFFSIGGDPADLMSYMVRNPGLLPGMTSLLNGDITRKRQMIKEILDGCWKACYETDGESGKRFAADAIISNPPAFAHIHCAEALGIPVHLSFTMPWSATTAFPHPLVSVSSSNAEPGLTNYLTYGLADLMQWQGLGDVINRFRGKTLGLPPLTLRSGPSLNDRLKVPWTYCFSPALIPKPKDWMNHIDVVGFYFLDGAKNYKPEKDLVEFLEAGPPPIYIGFGSVVVEDSKAMTTTIFDAVKESGVRAIVSAGWGGLGGTDVPSNIFILPGHPGVPHDWLFTKVFAVCHHGGAGTTAIGLLLGKPTIVVPFFGDQPFWGRMIHNAGAGPKPIPQKKLTSERLAEGIKFCTTEGAKAAAAELGGRIKAEDGRQKGVDSFHAHLPLLNMRCDLDPSRVAVWWSPEHCLKLSAYSAAVLAEADLLKLDKLTSHRPKEYETKAAIREPIGGGVGAIFWTITNFYGGIAEIFVHPVKGTIRTTLAIPQGILGIVGDVQEGFQNMPLLYGSKVRQRGPVTNFKSGLIEGGKGAFFGISDAMTGLVTEPFEGAKKEGFLGFVKGSARSYVNATMRPAAGFLGIVTNPAQGLWKGMQKSWAKQQNDQVRETRRLEGLEALRVPRRGGKDKQTIIRLFEEAKKTTKERREGLRKKATDFYASGGSYSFQPNSPDHTQAGPSSPTPTQEPPRRLTKGDSKRSSTPSDQPPPYRSLREDEEEAAFQRDLDLATRLSLGDHPTDAHSTESKN